MDNRDDSAFLYGLLVFSLILFVISCFGLVASIRQGARWEQERQACADAGGISWQAKNSGGPICLRRDALQEVEEDGRYE